jgi:hypothetical protein
VCHSGLSESVLLRTVCSHAVVQTSSVSKINEVTRHRLIVFDSLKETSVNEMQASDGLKFALNNGF